MKTTTARYTTVRKCKTCDCYTSRLLTSDEVRQAEFHDCYPLTRPELLGVKASNGRVWLACRTCGTKILADSVRGKLSTKHECGAKCMSSHGFQCECSCGGKNHGAAYTA